MIFVHARHERHRFFGIGKLQNERFAAYRDRSRVVPYRFVDALPFRIRDARVARGIVYGDGRSVILARFDGRRGCREVRFKPECCDYRFELEQIEQRIAALIVLLRNELDRHVIVLERNCGVGRHHFVHCGERTGIPVFVTRERAHSVEKHVAGKHVFHAEQAVVDINIIGIGGIGLE